MHKYGYTIFALVLMGAFHLPARADVVVLNTSDRGYYYDYDFNEPTNKNYLTGQIGDGSTATGFHSFFSFDALSGLNGPIVSATLSLYNPDGGYDSTQASETLTIGSFSGDVATLNGGGTVSGEYAALGSGTVFGTQSVSAADDNKFVDITLNADAIAFLNANGGSAFAFGGYLAGIPANDGDSRFVFGGSAFIVSNDSNTVLTLVTNPVSAVPEPRVAFLLIPGMLGVIAAANRRRSGVTNSARRTG